MPTVDKQTGEIRDDPETEADAAENEHEHAGESLAARYDRDETEDGPPPESDTYETHVAESPALTQKQLEALGRKIDAAATTHENALRRILGADFAEWMPCPLCMTDGHFMPIPAEQRNPEQVQAVLAALGQDGYSELTPAPDLETCDVCNGYGRVRTPSHAPGNEVVNCMACDSRGYKRVIPPPAEAVAYIPPPPPLPANASVWNGAGSAADPWGRQIGHPHYGLDPNQVGVA